MTDALLVSEQDDGQRRLWTRPEDDSDDDTRYFYTPTPSPANLIPAGCQNASLLFRPTSTPRASQASKENPFETNFFQSTGVEKSRRVGWRWCWWWWWWGSVGTSSAPTVAVACSRPVRQASWDGRCSPAARENVDKGLLAVSLQTLPMHKLKPSLPLTVG